MRLACLFVDVQCSLHVWGEMTPPLSALKEPWATIVRSVRKVMSCNPMDNVYLVQTQQN